MNPNNRVTQEEINALLDNAQTEEHIFRGKELLVSFLLPSGFTITGRAAVIDPSIFDIETGRRIARNDASRQLWLLEGYRKQLALANTPLYQQPENPLVATVSLEQLFHFRCGSCDAWWSVADRSPTIGGFVTCPSCGTRNLVLQVEHPTPQMTRPGVNPSQTEEG